jgi:hypothetical protein
MLQARANRILLLISKVDLLAQLSVKQFLTVSGNLCSIFFCLISPKRFSFHQKYCIEKTIFNDRQFLFSSIVFTYIRREDLK